MKISLSAQDDILQLTCQPDPEDVEFYSTRRGKLARDAARFKHPDILALLALIVFGPFAHRKIQMSWGVSRHFAETAAGFLKREISPVDSTLEPRRAPAAARPALAFSGGVDSYAAVALLPESVVPIFCHRIVPESLPRGMYCADAALAACKILNATHTGSILDTDMEFTRAPMLLEVPVHHEDVLPFSLFGLKCGPHAVLDALRAKTQPTYDYAGGLGLLEDHYSKSLELVPKMLREGVAEKIARYAAPYSAADVEFIQHWDIEPLTRTEQYQRSQEKLAQLLT